MIAYLNGQYIPLVEASVPVWDYGFAMGVSLTERMRTYGGGLPLLELHLNRLFAAVDLVGMTELFDRSEIEAAVKQVVKRNLEKSVAGVELSVGICLTPGAMGAFAAGESANQPTVAITANELPVGQWQDAYRDGVSLVTVDVQEIPSQCIPKSIKHRNRLHYFLAEKQAAEKMPGARALLFDEDGFVAEGTTASVMAVREGKLLRPKSEKVLPSVSFEYAVELLAKQGVEIVEADLTVEQFQAADEVLWFSSPVAVLPVAELDGKPIGSGQRPVFDELIKAWEQKTGIDLIYRKRRRRRR